MGQGLRYTILGDVRKEDHISMIVGSKTLVGARLAIAFIKLVIGAEGAIEVLSM